MKKIELLTLEVYLVGLVLYVVLIFNSYVNNERDLIDCINTIKASDQILFEKYVFTGNSKSNIKNLMEKFL